MRTVDAPPQLPTVDAASSLDATSIDSALLAPGVYATITGSHFAGTHAMIDIVICERDIDARAYRAFGSNHGGDKDISVFVIPLPEANASYTSPDFWVNLYAFNVQDTDRYPPQAGPGSCTIQVELGWPNMRARFSCTGLVAANGSTFAIEDGRVICPDV